MFRGKKEMKLISQSQIRDFQTCPQKYYLSHILKLSWPAPPSPLFKKLEEEAALGETFHLFVHRIIQGLNPEESAFETENKTIAKWIDNFLRNYPLPQDAVLYSERELTNLDEDILWIGKFDVIATLQNKILIFDWKTSQKAGKVLWLEESPQTRLYRYLLYQNRQLYSYDGTDHMKPEQIEMIYWFVNFPNSPIHIRYSEKQFAADRQFLKEIAAKINSDKAENYPKTSIEKVCNYCQFQTYCKRGFPDQSDSEYEPDWNNLPLTEEL
jgi:CRISPR/Cas system-associated exonuclease Cas4 (RecB family)